MIDFVVVHKTLNKLLRKVLHMANITYSHCLERWTATQCAQCPLCYVYLYHAGSLLASSTYGGTGSPQCWECCSEFCCFLLTHSCCEHPTPLLILSRGCFFSSILLNLKGHFFNLKLSSHVHVLYIELLVTVSLTHL